MLLLRSGDLDSLVYIRPHPERADVCLAGVERQALEGTYPVLGGQGGDALLVLAWACLWGREACSHGLVVGILWEAGRVNVGCRHHAARVRGAGTWGARDVAEGAVWSVGGEGGRIRGRRCHGPSVGGEGLLLRNRGWEGAGGRSWAGKGGR